MGGYGSSRWSGQAKADTVEDTHSLSIAALRQHVQFGAPGCFIGAVSWSGGSSISFTLTSQQLTLSYRIRRPGQDWHEREETITLQTTRPHYGGVRWWFTCPVCAGRAGVVYLDAARFRFSCRQCAALVYRSQQEHCKAMDPYARLFREEARFHKEWKRLDRQRRKRQRH